jgi:hypothetical protein
MRATILVSAYIIANAIDKHSITLEIKIMMILLLFIFAFSDIEGTKNK